MQMHVWMYSSMCTHYTIFNTKTTFLAVRNTLIFMHNIYMKTVTSSAVRTKLLGCTHCSGLITI